MIDKIGIWGLSVCAVGLAIVLSPPDPVSVLMNAGASLIFVWAGYWLGTRKHPRANVAELP